MELKLTTEEAQFLANVLIEYEERNAGKTFKGRERTEQIHKQVCRAIAIRNRLVYLFEESAQS